MPIMLLPQGLTVLELINTINDFIITQSVYPCLWLAPSDTFVPQNAALLLKKLLLMFWRIPLPASVSHLMIVICQSHLCLQRSWSKMWLRCQAKQHPMCVMRIECLTIYLIAWTLAWRLYYPVLVLLVLLIAKQMMEMRARPSSIQVSGMPLSEADVPVSFKSHCKWFKWL